MTEDARFEDGAERALNLGAESPEDLQILSALVQDAVLTAADIVWEAKARRLAFLLNRFRWEDRTGAAERSRAVLVIRDVTRIAGQGITKGDADTILSLLGLTWEPGADGTGRIVLTFAGDGAIAITVECIDAQLRDVTQPYIAPSGKVPHHPD